VKKALPYWFKRYVFMDKTATLEPLYHFDQPEVKKSVEKS